MSIKEFIVLSMVCMIWGMHFVVMKVTVNGVAEPLFYAAVRMTIVALILLPFLRIKPGQMLPLLGAGLGYGALNYAFSFPALKFTTASAAAVTMELFVPFSIILSVIVFKDKIGVFKISGIVIAFVGAAIVALAKPDEVAGPLFLLGIGLMMLAAMSEAVGAILVKTLKEIKPLEMLAWFAVVGSCVLWTLSLIFEENQLSALAPETRYQFLAALAYSAFAVSIIAHGSYYWLLQRLPIYIAATGGLMSPVITVAASALFLGEPITLSLVFGGLMTLVGVGIILLRSKKAPEA